MKPLPLAAALVLSSFLLPTSTFPQGSLTPPGPPAPTMKALDQIASTGIAINANNTPGDATNEFIIAQAGSYYLTGNLNVAKDNGIHITAAGVTVDLNGFQIAATPGPLSSGVGNGIALDAAARSCAIRNGSITGFTGTGLTGNGILGLSNDGAISHVTASNCNGGLVTGDGWLIDNCYVHDNTGDGMGTAVGCTISYCTATNNAGRGINIGSGCTILACTASGNRGSAGINTGDGCTVVHCTAMDNTSTAATSAGIHAGSGCTLTACTADGNKSTNGTPTGLTGAGILVGLRSTVQNCSATVNKGDGIEAFSDCIIAANLCSDNGLTGDGAGVHVTGSNNRIEGNNVTFNDRGIDVDAGGNLIIKNSASDNTTNYDIAIGNSFGAIVTAGTNISPVSGSTAASTLGSTDPWANFSY
jgi:parallel beta-helix repeat protein